MDRWVRVASWLLPAGLHEIRQRVERLRSLGLPLTSRNLIRSGRILQSADNSGLAMLPTGALRELDVVVDVGGNVGEWSAAFLTCHQPQALIIFEPIPECARTIASRFKGVPGVRVMDCVVGDRDAPVTFHVTNDSTGSSVHVPAEKMKAFVGTNWEIAEVLTTQMRTLDEALAGCAEISLLKIDVQGFEAQVLEGAVHTLGRTRFLLIELNILVGYDGGSEFTQIHNMLVQRFGFKLHGLGSLKRLSGEASHLDALYLNPQRHASPSAAAVHSV